VAQKLAKTIVMVDDNLDEIFLTRRQLQRDGVLDAFVEESRPERLLCTLDGLAQKGGDLAELIILLDINMPRLNGFDVLRQLRASDDYRDVSVIMLSASDDDADKTQARNLGADGYIVKPLTTEALRTAVASRP
jgi:CheY-like chemotaxis protein